MSESVRVRLENGVEKTFPADHPAVGAEGVQVLKDAKAVDQHGEPLPDTMPDDEPEGPPSYKGVRKPALKAEIALRNRDRGDDNQLDDGGTVDELVAVLEADDKATADAQAAALAAADGNTDSAAGPGPDNA